jgi:hypothetical protein
VRFEILSLAKWNAHREIWKTCSSCIWKSAVTKLSLVLRFIAYKTTIATMRRARISSKTIGT